MDGAMVGDTIPCSVGEAEGMNDGTEVVGSGVGVGVG